MNIDLDVVSKDWAKRLTDAISINNFSVGWWNTFTAKKPDRKKTIMDRNAPSAALKSNPVCTKALSSSVLFSKRYWAMYFVKAEETPKSKNRAAMETGIIAMVTWP